PVFLRANMSTTTNTSKRKAQTTYRISTLQRKIPAELYGALREGAPAGNDRLIRAVGKAAVDLLTQGFAWLEVRHTLLGHQNLLSRLGITPDTGRAARQRKAAEAANLDALAGPQGLGHRIEDRLDRIVGIAHRQLWVAGG